MPSSEEPWLRGALAGVDPLLAPTLHSLTQVREDLARLTNGLTDEHMWLRPSGLTSLGFHLRHMAGSLDRLTTYMEDGQLTREQLAFLHEEATPGAGVQDLLDALNHAIDRASAAVRALDVTRLREPRAVGRKRLPTTAIGLAVHLAEHTQRHLGACIVLCRLLSAAAAGTPPSPSAAASL